MGGVLSCCAAELACCFGKAACNCCMFAGGHFCGAYSSIATRVGYSLLLFLIASLSWLSLTDSWKSNFANLHKSIDNHQNTLQNSNYIHYYYAVDKNSIPQYHYYINKNDVIIQNTLNGYDDKENELDENSLNKRDNHFLSNYLSFFSIPDIFSISDSETSYIPKLPNDSDPVVKPVARWWLAKLLSPICKDGRCYGELAVYRLTFSLAIFHLILAILLYNVKSSRDVRSSLQNGFWAWKIGALLGLLSLSFIVLPNSFFIFVSKFIQLPAAIIFLLIQLVLLIDFAYSFTNVLISHYEETESKLSVFVLLGLTFIAFIFTIAITIVNFIYFGLPGKDKSGDIIGDGTCKLNQFFIIFNIIICIIVSIGSIIPSVQEANPRSGLAQAAMVIIYSTYLLSSALISEPNITCNPFLRDHKSNHDPNNPITNKTPTNIVVYGAILTFIAIAYSTTRSASSDFFSSPGSFAGLDDEDREPLLTNSNYGNNDDDEDDEYGGVEDDEKDSVQYSYSFFHIIFMLAAMYICMLVTNWKQVKQDNDDSGGVVVIGRSMWAVWVKIVSSWVAVLLYGWSLIAPLILTDRIFD